MEIVLGVLRQTTDQRFPGTVSNGWDEFSSLRALELLLGLPQNQSCRRKIEKTTKDKRNWGQIVKYSQIRNEIKWKFGSWKQSKPFGMFGSSSRRSVGSTKSADTMGQPHQPQESSALDVQLLPKQSSNAPCIANILAQDCTENPRMKFGWEIIKDARRMQISKSWTTQRHISLKPVCMYTCI